MCFYYSKTKRDVGYVFQERVRLRYKLTYLLGERQYAETGELDDFPPADRWGSL